MSQEVEFVHPSIAARGIAVAKLTEWMGLFGEESLTPKMALLAVTRLLASDEEFVKAFEQMKMDAELEAQE